MNIKEILDSDFRGIIHIVQDNKILCENVTGFAEVPNTLETKFASASAGKVFVAVGVLQLIEQGKLKFDDTLGKLLDIELNHIDKDVTVRQLLVHTSGVPDYLQANVFGACDIGAPGRNPVQLGKYQIISISIPVSTMICRF